MTRSTLRFSLTTTDPFGVVPSGDTRAERDAARAAKRERGRRRERLLRETPRTERARTAMLLENPDLWTDLVISRDVPTGGGVRGLGYFVETTPIKKILNDGTVIDLTKEV